MFEYSEDITLLHGAFLSAQTRAQKDFTNDFAFEFNDSEFEQIVSSSVQKILSFKIFCKLNDKTILQSKISKSQRMHAVIFHSILKSSGIACDAADEFYEAIIGLLPPFTWKFYARLNVLCNWSDNFVECAIQLPDDIFVLVMKEMLNQLQNSDNKFYLQSCVTQAFIRKVFISRKLSKFSLREFPFNFDFQKSGDSTNTADKSDTVISHPSCVAIFNEIYCDIYERIALEMSKDEKSIDFARLLLQGIVTTLKLFVVNNIGEADQNELMEKVTEILLQAEDYLLSNSCLSAFQMTMEGFKTEQFYKQCAQSVSSSVESYLTFLLRHYWKDVLAKTEISKPWHNSIHKIAKGLYSLNPLSKPVAGTVLDEHVGLLLFVIQCKLPEVEYALKIVLTEETILERNDVICCLEKEHSLFSDSFSDHSLKLLIDGIMKIKQTNSRYVKLLLEICEKLSSGQKDKLLHYIFQHYGMDSTMKLESFNEELMAFMNYTVSVQQAEQTIAQLCFQSTEEVIKSIIGQAVRNGAQSTALIQALKFVPSACKHKPATNAPTILVKCLQPYLAKKNLQLIEHENIEFLVTTLVQKKEFTFMLDEFLEKCVIPNISLGDPNQLFLCLDLLDVCIRSKKKGFFDELQTRNLVVLLAMLLQVLDHSIVARNGRLKEVVLTTFNLLVAQKNKMNLGKELFWLMNIAEKLNPLTKLYALQLLQDEPDLVAMPLSHLWTWCCVGKGDRISLVEEKLVENNTVDPYKLMVANLAPLLCHFTSVEWLRSSLLIEKCLHFSSFKLENIFPDHTVWNLSRGDILICTVIRCLVESLLLVKAFNDVRTNWSYMINSFANVIKNYLQQDSVLSCTTLILMFWEVCHLASNFNSEEIVIFRPVLLDLLRKINLCKDDEIDTSKLLAAVVRNLPQCNETCDLLEQLQ